MNSKTKPCIKLFLALLAVLLSFALTGCSSRADAIASPLPTNGVNSRPGENLMDDVKDMMPSATPGTSASPDSDIAASSSGPNSLDEIRKASEQMEDAIDMLSEVDDAYVIAIGNRALIGIEFDDQYQGELDDRVKEMILARVQTINKTVDELYITADPVTSEVVEQLADTLESSTTLTSISEAFNQIAKDIQAFKK